MRVLVVHNFYRSDSPSGENSAVAAEIALLQQAGIEVDSLLPNSDDIRGGAKLLRAAGATVHSPSVARDVAQRLARVPYDVVHVHNVFPTVGPALVREAARRGVKVVHTAHNYRLSCMKGTHFRKGQICESCTSLRVKSPAILHGCYRDSHLQSIPMVTSRALNHRSWMTDVDTFIALTPFMKRRLEIEGVSEGRIVIRPSWSSDPGEPDDMTSRPPTLLYVGRLDDFKGTELLMQAWTRMRYQRDSQGQPGVLCVAGAGPLEGMVRERAAIDDTIEFRGALTPEEVGDAMRGARALVVPSLCFEGFPLVVVEALGRGVPILTVAGGAVATVVDPTIGWVTERNPDALAAGMSKALATDGSEMRWAARDRYEAEHTPEAALSSLLRIYTR